MQNDALIGMYSPFQIPGRLNGKVSAKEYTIQGNEITTTFLVGVISDIPLVNEVEVCGLVVNDIGIGGRIYQSFINHLPEAPILQDIDFIYGVLNKRMFAHILRSRRLEIIYNSKKLPNHSHEASTIKRFPGQTSFLAFPALTTSRPTIHLKFLNNDPSLHPSLSFRGKIGISIGG